MATPDRVDEIQAQWHRERPDLDVSPLAVIARLHRLGARLTTELVAVYRRFDLGEGEFDILATLRREGGELTPSDLAERTMVTTGAISKRVDRLERAGLVRRSLRESDGRGRLVTLTDEGRSRIDAAFEAHMAGEARLVAVLSPQDRRELERLLRAWAAGLDATT